MMWNMAQKERTTGRHVAVSLEPMAGHWRPPLRKVPYDKGFDPEGIDAKRTLDNAGRCAEVAWSRSVHDHACIVKNALC